jgi:methyl-accepting chemotaxis protein
MRIRAKLTLLILGMVALFAVAISLYFALLAPVDKMEREKSYYTDLAYAMRVQQVRINRLPFKPILPAFDSFEEASAGVDAAFLGLKKVKVLPTVNADLKKATRIIGNLSTLFGDRLQKVRTDHGAVLEAYKALFSVVDNTVSLDQVYTNSFSKLKLPMVDAAAKSQKAFMTSLEIMNGSIEGFAETIAEQYSIIDREISAVRGRALGTAGLIVLLIIGVAIFGALAFANGIAKSIIRIERNIILLKEGDLSERSELATKDEIGALSRNLNLFLDGLSSSIVNIKQISKANIEAKNRLIDAASEATSSATQIGASANSIGKQIGNLDDRIAESSGSVGKIVASIAELNAQIEGQGAMVEEATASVTEMLSSLENMSRTTEKNRGAAEDLVVVAERGRSIFETASAKIGEIPQNIGVIREMATVIQNIASQTNLLAMNAAIEAAHAGEAGRGFAVVADEIRKLSEASTTSSRDIAESINAIVANIDEATEANAGTNGAFAAIDGRIRDVSRSMAEIYASISEIQVGSKQILEAMVDLQDRSMSVRSGSKSMEEGSAEIESMMQDASRISREVAANISEIAKGIEDIGSSIRAVGSLSEDVGSGSASLDAEVSRFRTAAAGEGQVSS